MPYVVRNSLIIYRDDNSCISMLLCNKLLQLDDCVDCNAVYRLVIFSICEVNRLFANKSLDVSSNEADEHNDD